MNCTRAIGALYMGEGRSEFCVWAPLAATVHVHVVNPLDRVIALQRDSQGYHSGIAEDLPAGALYTFRLDGGDAPDPASRFQPQGVHGPSQLIDPAFPWDDDGWRGLPLQDYILYELHVGTFTPEGTFDAIIPHLEILKDLGITALELMPVAQFPGERNWGYDGAYPYAVQNSYGGPDSLKRLINACHVRGIAVVLDVVYNHLGPEGNYLAAFGPYFTNRYHTSWGDAINFDGAESDHVRNYFFENALYWVTEYKFDALRLDAIHGIFDFSATHFLEELAQVVHERAERLGRLIYLIAESDLNDSRLVRPRSAGGYQLDAQWSDDFHHALHCVITEERAGYYEDFGALDQLAKAYREGFVYTGQYSHFRRRRHGNSAADIAPSRFVVFSQNHDQVGNRCGSERLSCLAPWEALKAAAAAVILSPFIPLLFMGEEYGETNAFQYFVSHSDPELVEAVRRGRQEEFSSFNWHEEPPDPQAESTFLSAKLRHDLRTTGPHRSLFDFYKELIALRKGTPALAGSSRQCMDVESQEEDRVLVLRRWCPLQQCIAIFHFRNVAARVDVDVPAGHLHKRLDSSAPRWNGPGTEIPDELESDGHISLFMTPYCCVVFTLP